MDGVLVVDKPRGMTSHDVVSRARRALRTRAVGHAGTLDPMATGVLVLAVGEATKLVPYLTADDKEYVTTVRFGVETDSLDADGITTVTEEPTAALLDALREGAEAPLLREALREEAARTEQVPPNVSAIHVDGERAYDRARRGETLVMPPRPVLVRRLAVTTTLASPPELGLRVEVAKGYYVRSLARDLAARLGTVAHLVALRRTRSGGFRAEDALPFDQLVRGEDGAPTESVRRAVVGLEEAARRVLPSAVLDPAAVVNARAGREVRSPELSPHEAMAWFDEAGELVAIGRVDELAVGKVLRGMNSARQVT